MYRRYLFSVFRSIYTNRIVTYEYIVQNVLETALLQYCKHRLTVLTYHSTVSQSKIYK